ncbi:MAG: PorT family protein [Pedobacter sp.]|nr:MAG: PorT family protein [Pedobacter sp.]
MLLALSCLILSLSSHAQKLTPGFIVSSKGDTTKGFINYRNWKQTPSSVQFVKSESETPKSYAPTDISAFGVDIKGITNTYRSAEVNIDISSDQIDKLDTEGAFVDKKVTVFLRVLLVGTYTLYSFEDHKEHFFIGKSKDINELKFKNFITGKNRTVVNNEQYKAQLTKLLKDCNLIKPEDITNLPYSSSDIVKLLVDYDKCKGNASAVNETKDDGKVVFGVIAGVDIARFKFVPYQGLEVTLNSTGNFAIGGTVQICLPRTNRASSFVFELLYRQYKFDETISYTAGANESYVSHYAINGKYVRLNTMFRYQFTQSKLKPFFNLGVSNAFKIGEIDKTTTRKTFFSTVIDYEDPLFAEERGYEQGINLGVGIGIKKLSVELRAETTNGFSSTQVSRTGISALFLNLGYTF